MSLIYKKASIASAMTAISLMNMWADITFNWETLPKNDSNISGYPYEYAYIYKDGIQVSSNHFYPHEKNQLNIPIDKGSYSYSTTMGHVGDVSSQDNIKLTIHTLILRLTTPEGLPITNERIAVYRNGAEIKYTTTNQEGYARFLLSPSDQYAYRCNYGEGAIMGLDNEASNERVEMCITAHTIIFVAKYGHYPIPDKFMLVSDTGEDDAQYGTYTRRDNGMIYFLATPNKPYHIQNDLGITTGPYFTSGDINYLEYRKVTFISENGQESSILKDLRVSAADNRKTKSVTTDGRGRAIVYLLPGNYQWHHLSGNGSFTVSDEDLEILLTPKPTNIRFANNGKGVAGLKYTVTDDIAGEQKGVTNDSGIAEISLIGEESSVSVNGLGAYPLSASMGYADILVCKLNVDGGKKSSYFVLSDSRSRSARFPCGTDIYLLPGKYKIGVSSYSTENHDIDISDDTKFTLSDNTVKVKVTDSDGIPVTDQILMFGINGSSNKSITTNSAGECSVNLQSGVYMMQDPYQLISRSINVDSDSSIEVTIPKEITFTIENNGLPYDGYAIWTVTGGKTSSIQVVDGVAKARIDTDNPGTISMSGYQSADIPLTLREGSRLNMVDAHVGCTGRGIVVPSLGEMLDGKILQGQVIRLKAIPTQYGTFSHWTINGTRYDEDVIDFTVGADGLDATATFDESTTSVSAATTSNSVQWNVTPNPATTEIHFPEEVNAKVSIYNASGQEIQSARVIGSSMNVSELTSGVYFLVANDSEHRPLGTARFVKR